MRYIVYDLEFNQDFSKRRDQCLPRPCFEIIQIGAVRLDQNLNYAGTFCRYVKPVIYPEINPFITELTGITTGRLSAEETFPGVYKNFIEFAGDSDSVFCVWGMADIKELFRNISYHQLNQKLITKKYLNVQPYTSQHFKLSQKKLLKLKTAVEMLNITEDNHYHDALNDAKYTAEIFRKIYQDSFRPILYDPDPAKRPRQAKKQIDFAGVFKQFEKMYERPLTEEEEKIIKLAYQMGKTRQFLK